MFFFLLDFFFIIKGPESGKEKNRKSGIRTFEISRTTGTGRDVRLSPKSWMVTNKKAVFWYLNGFLRTETAK